MAGKYHKFNSDIYEEDEPIVEQTKIAKNLTSNKDALHELFNQLRGKSQTESISSCEQLVDGHCISNYPKLVKTDELHCRACQKAKKLEENKSNPQEPKHDTIGDLCNAPPCNHRQIIRGKEGVEFLCIFRRPCSPPQQVKLKSIKVCTTCKSQEYNLPTRTKISETNTQEGLEPESEELVAPERAKQPEPKISEPEYMPLEYWKPTYANHAFSDGGRFCPFKTGKVYSLDCKLCEKGYPKKHQMCAELRMVHVQR